MSDYIITRAAIEAMEGLSKAHFLNPDAQRINKSLGDLTGLSGFGFHIIEVPPGKDSTELHVHHFEDECVYILSGNASAQIGDEHTPVGEGGFIGYPAGGKAHKLTNTGTTPLKCIVVGQRLAHDVGDYPRSGKRIYRNSGFAWNLVDLDDITQPSGGKKF